LRRSKRKGKVPLKITLAAILILTLIFHVLGFGIAYILTGFCVIGIVKEIVGWIIDFVRWLNDKAIESIHRTSRN
jgi:hypothetical protein